MCYISYISMNIFKQLKIPYYTLGQIFTLQSVCMNFDANDYLKCTWWFSKSTVYLFKDKEVLVRNLKAVNVHNLFVN